MSCVTLASLQEPSQGLRVLNCKTGQVSDLQGFSELQILWFCADALHLILNFYTNITLKKKKANVKTFGNKRRRNSNIPPI